MATDSLMAVARPLLIKHEGWKPTVYKDSKGIKTIGVGFNLEQAGAKELCARVGADYDAICNGTPLTPEQIDSLLNHFIISTLEWLTHIFADFSSYSVNRQAALVDMGFNLGQHTFCQFHGMIGAIDAGCWATAAQHAQDSLWARQVGKRASDIEELFING